MDVKAIAFINRKGGTGKTTLAFNIAVEIASKGFRVSFIECDFSTRSATYLWDPRFISMEDDYYTLKDYMLGDCGLEDIIYVSRRFRELENIYFVPGGFVKEDEREIFTRHEENLKKLDRLVDFLYDKSELIFIDTPASGNIYSLVDYLMFIPIADAVIPVIDPTNPSIDGVKPLLKLASLMGVKCPITICNKYKRERIFDRQTLEEISRKLFEFTPDKPELFTVPFDQSVIDSWRKKRPIVLFKPRCKASRAIKKIASKLVSCENLDSVNLAFSGEEAPERLESKLEELERLLSSE